MKTILITGGAGFIGSSLARALRRQNKVIVLDNLITSNGSNLRDLKKAGNFKFFKHDISKPFTSEIKSEVHDVDEIYHLACPTGVANIITLGVEMIEACTKGTEQILDLAKEKNAKFLFTSSSEVYGDALVSPQTEDYSGNVDPRGLRSPYEEGKRLSESLVSLYSRLYKIPTVIARIFNTYGPGMADDDSRVIPKFLNYVKKGKPLPVHGSGEQNRTFCYIDDTVKGLILLMGKGEHGEVYNLGSEKQITIQRLAEMISSMNGGSNIRHVRRPTHDHDGRLPDLRKIKRLGWSETVDLREGLERTKL